MGLSTAYGAVGTDTGVMIAPVELARETRPGLVVAHGRGGNGVSVLYAASVTMSESVMPSAQIWPTVCTDMGGTTHWGNDAAVTRFGEAVTAVRAGVANTGPVLIYLLSMGTMVGLRWALANPSEVAAIAIGLGTVDLAYMHDQNTAGWAAEMETAHGVGGTWAGNATITARDPMQNTAALSALASRMHFWFASDDIYAITARQQAFIDAVGCGSTNLGAVGHTANAVPGAQVADWFKGYA